eukprot:gnl/MRDRNA2_/MRDRNA2_299199_c0_seq1.p1 gnl/MRDRNA2_/MRDRNA2_299199_c0~~gnl/MRDRNA2_/MRDRNA2_299199_c0_seq1.p1  ORF type:complete len:113 (+),score=26.09 gnl/MRDRNA2_/MRDRNA2_299199_c0_seq1:47-340(+)
MYDIPRLQAAVEALLFQQVNAGAQLSCSQIIDILQFSMRYDCATIKEAALDFIQCNFTKVAKEPSFYGLAAHDAETYGIIVEAIGTQLQEVKRRRHI